MTTTSAENDDPVDPDVDFEKLKSASLALAVILAEAASSPDKQAVVGLAQIEGIYDAISDGMLGYAWLRDEVIGAARGSSLLADLEAGLSDDDQRLLTRMFSTPGLRAD